MQSVEYRVNKLDTVARICMYNVGGCSLCAFYIEVKGNTMLLLAANHTFASKSFLSTKFLRTVINDTANKVYMFARSHD